MHKKTINGCLKISCRQKSFNYPMALNNRRYLDAKEGR